MMMNERMEYINHFQQQQQQQQQQQHGKQNNLPRQLRKPLPTTSSSPLPSPNRNFYTSQYSSPPAVVSIPPYVSVNVNMNTGVDMNMQMQFNAQTAAAVAAVQQQQQFHQQQVQQQPHTPTDHMTDTIHEKVRTMLSQSRLVRNNSTTHPIQLLGPEDIWNVQRTLGSGAFSQVSEVTLTRDLQQPQQQHQSPRYACKHLKKELLERPQEFQTAACELAYEAHMMSAFDHPNILKIRGWAQNGISSFEDGRHDSFFLLLDLLDESLDQRIDRWNVEAQQQSVQSSQSSSPSMLLMEKIQVLTEIASALDYVHEQGVIFRDLKPNNIGMLNGHVQLFDFGLSRELPLLDTVTPFQMSGKVGTIRYMAPEVVLHQPYNVSADVYSWTMVAYEVLTGEKPFTGWTPELYTEYVCRQGMRPEFHQNNNNNNKVHDSAVMLSQIEGQLQQLLQQGWKTQATQRPCFKQIIAQLKGYQDILLQVSMTNSHLEQQQQQQQQQQMYDFHHHHHQQQQQQQQQQYLNHQVQQQQQQQHHQRQYPNSNTIFMLQQQHQQQQQQQQHCHHEQMSIPHSHGESQDFFIDLDDRLNHRLQQHQQQQQRLRQQQQQKEQQQLRLQIQQSYSVGCLSVGTLETESISAASLGW